MNTFGPTRSENLEHSFLCRPATRVMLVRGLSRGAVFDLTGCKDFLKEHIPVLFEHLGDSIAPDDIGPDAEQSA